MTYHRTQNENGTFNTLCLDCLRTIASSMENEDALKQAEAAHLCPEKALSLLTAQSMAAFTVVHSGR